MVADHLGSPRLVIDSASNAVSQRIDRDAWGAVVANGAPTLQPFSRSASRAACTTPTPSSCTSARATTTYDPVNHLDTDALLEATLPRQPGRGLCFKGTMPVVINQ